MRKMRKPLIAGIALALVAALGVGTTLAWLTDEESVTNTFTVGNVDIELYEHKYDPNGDGSAKGQVGTLGSEEVKANSSYKLVPGVDMPKDPTVRVAAGSEDCWLFVKVDEKNNADDKYIQWEIDTAVWTELEGGVWYRQYTGGGDSEFGVIEGNEITVNPNATKTDMNAIDGVDADGSTESDAAKAEVAARPTLTFTAYAVQKAGFDTAEAAWKTTFGA